MSIQHFVHQRKNVRGSFQSFPFVLWWSRIWHLSTATSFERRWARPGGIGHVYQLYTTDCCEHSNIGLNVSKRTKHISATEMVQTFSSTFYGKKHAIRERFRPQWIRGRYPTEPLLLLFHPGSSGSSGCYWSQATLGMRNKEYQAIDFPFFFFPEVFSSQSLSSELM